MKQLTTIIESILDTDLDLDLTMKHLYTIKRGKALLSQQGMKYLRGVINLELFNSEVKDRVKSTVRDFDLRNVIDVIQRYFMSCPAAELNQRWLDDVMVKFNKRYIPRKDIYLTAQLEGHETVAVWVNVGKMGYKLDDYIFEK